MCPHSLGTLIEWKQTKDCTRSASIERSPLAGDTNRMETLTGVMSKFIAEIKSPLAGDTNRMETGLQFVLARIALKSPLAGDTNRMETTRNE